MSVTHLSRPQRWDSPFDTEMDDTVVNGLMGHPLIADIDSASFPSHTPLHGILKNDARVVNFNSGDIIVREGDYGSSAYIILEGSLRVFTDTYPKEILGRSEQKRKSLTETIKQLWLNSTTPEKRDISRYGKQKIVPPTNASIEKTHEIHDDATVNVADVVKQFATVALGNGEFFGELAALGRIPRTTTIFSETDSILLEIRWQGLREIRRFDSKFRKMVDDRYRQNALSVHLRETDLFSNLNDATINQVAEATLFETYGTFDWHSKFQKLRANNAVSIEEEPIIAREGEYADGLLMIRAGFARVSQTYGNGHRTITYLRAGEFFGLAELKQNWEFGKPISLKASLSALGYVDVLRVPGWALEKYVFPEHEHIEANDTIDSASALSEDALLEWAVEERFINANEGMLIDLDRCVRCDDCVRACASTHGGNPRFIRQGKTFDHWMVANACMHCADPVCMIGCPTGAIHRTQIGGMVVINDDTCVGCSTCATSCPYNNIRMVEIRDLKGDVPVDPENGQPILKATKCDLCYTNPGGPACVRACPHDALKRVNFRPESLKGGALR